MKLRALCAILLPTIAILGWWLKKKKIKSIEDKPKQEASTSQDTHIKDSSAHEAGPSNSEVVSEAIEKPASVSQVKASGCPALQKSTLKNNNDCEEEVIPPPTLEKVPKASVVESSSLKASNSKQNDTSSKPDATLASAQNIVPQEYCVTNTQEQYVSKSKATDSSSTDDTALVSTASGTVCDTKTDDQEAIAEEIVIKEDIIVVKNEVVSKGALEKKQTVINGDVQPSSNCDAHGSPESTTSNCDAHSEGSNDSGKGASLTEISPSMTPAEVVPDFTVYEFDFPSELCGRLIGKGGKNINVIKAKTGAELSLKRKPFSKEVQVCTVEGTQAQVESAIENVKKKFPPNKVLTYERTNTILVPEIMQLNLPAGVSMDVMISSVVDANHVFAQQPTHPTFASLERLNYCMNLCYGQENIVPQLPRPVELGVICAAPMFNGWYRAQVVGYTEETDECDIKFVDYGGYMRVQSCVLRQIRSDFTTLPFQAVECYLANVVPPQGCEAFAPEASAVLEQMVHSRMLQAQVTSYEEDGVPYIQLYEVQKDKALDDPTAQPPEAVFINRELVNQGIAQWIEMST